MDRYCHRCQDMRDSSVRIVKRQEVVSGRYVWRRTTYDPCGHTDMHETFTDAQTREQAERGCNR